MTRPRSARTKRNDLCPCGSGNKFKHCHGAPQGNAREGSFALHFWGPLTFHALAQALRAAPQHPVSTVLGATRYASAHIPFHDSANHRGVHAMDCAVLALAALYRADVGPMYHRRLVIPEPHDLEPLLQKIATMGPSRRGGARDVTEIIATQSSISGLAAVQLYRALFLAELVDSPPGQNPYDDLMQKQYGCTTEEYFVFLSQPMIQAEKGELLTRFSLKETVPDGVRRAFLRVTGELATPVQDISRLLDEHLKAFTPQGYAHRLFLHRPLLEIRPGVYAPAPHPYTRLALSMGFLKPLALATARDGHPDTRESAHMGTRAEGLVRRFLSVLGGDLHGNEEYLRRQSDLSPDVILFEKDGSAVVGEVKLTRLSVDAFYGLDDQALSKFMPTLARPLKQVITYFHRIHVDADRLRDEHRAIAERLKAAPRVVLAGLFAALPPLAHAAPHRAELAKAVQAALSPTTRAWWAANESRFAWHVMDTEDLGWFVALIRDEGLGASLEAYVRSAHFGRFVDERSAPASFGSYARSRALVRGSAPGLDFVDQALADFARRAGRIIDPGYDPPEDP